jgi:cob(I)alamin adenosyltransferase
MDQMLEKGRIHLYTGNGKGKTTAALGLALRAAGAGMRTLIIQFMKGRHYSELDAVKMLHGMLTIEQYGTDDFYVPRGNSEEKHRMLASSAVDRAHRAIADPAYDILVLDEIITASVTGLSITRPSST